MARPQRDRCQRHHGMIRHQSQSKLLRDRRQNQRRLHQRKRIPDTLARAAAKRKVGKPWQSFHQIIFPAFRPEFFRRVVPSRVAMHHPLRHGHPHSFRHGVACNFMVFDGEPRQSPRRGIKPQRFRDDVSGVNKFWQIIERRSAIAQNGVQFRMQLFFHGGVLRQQPLRPGKCARRSFVAGQK